MDETSCHAHRTVDIGSPALQHVRSSLPTLHAQQLVSVRADRHC
jgi:hypothetical protein